MHPHLCLVRQVEVKHVDMVTTDSHTAAHWKIKTVLGVNEEKKKK